MALGAFFGFVQAALPPFAWLVMGDFMTYAIQREVCKFLHNKMRKYWFFSSKIFSRKM